jgi:hypothetical protein
VAFDQTPIGELSAGLMDDLEKTFGEDGRIGAVALIVEVQSDAHGSQVATKYSDPRLHVNLGLLGVAERSLKGT